MDARSLMRPSVPIGKGTVSHASVDDVCAKARADNRRAKWHTISAETAEHRAKAEALRREAEALRASIAKRKAGWRPRGPLPAPIAAEPTGMLHIGLPAQGFDRTRWN